MRFLSEFRLSCPGRKGKNEHSPEDGNRTRYLFRCIVILQQLDEIGLFLFLVKGDAALMQLCVQLGNLEGVADEAEDELTAARAWTGRDVLV